MIAPGNVLLDKYHIERVLGRGGMGEVMLARNLDLDQLVAMKFLLPEALERPDVVKRFHREARNAARLKNEYICQVYDVGRLDNGAPYIVMEYMDGTDVGKFLQQHGCPAPGVAVDFVLQACVALADAHAIGIVHRDIKLSNFYLTRRSDGSSVLKVLDFGISTAPAQFDTELTHTKDIMGTPSYMSPEQMRSSRQVDARSDIWSLGVVLYQLFTRSYPFTADTLPELCIKVAVDPTPAIQALLPDGLEAIVARCLEKDPAHRYQNVAELAAVLAPYARTPALAESAAARTARTLGLAAGPPFVEAPNQGDNAVADTESTIKLSPEQPPARPGSTHWRRIGLIAASVFAAVAGSAVLALNHNGAGPPSDRIADRKSTTETSNEVPQGETAALTTYRSSPSEALATRRLDAGQTRVVASRLDAAPQTATLSDATPAAVTKPRKKRRRLPRAGQKPSLRPAPALRKPEQPDPKERSSRPDQLVGQADRLLNKDGAWRDAKLLYVQVLDKTENKELLHKARLGLVTIAIKYEGDWDNAIDHAEWVLKHGSAQNTQALRYIAQAYEAQRDHASALVYYQQLLQVRPSDARAAQRVRRLCKKLNKKCGAPPE